MIRIEWDDVFRWLNGIILMRNDIKWQVNVVRVVCIRYIIDEDM